MILKNKQIKKDKLAYNFQLSLYSTYRLSTLIRVNKSKSSAAIQDIGLFAKPMFILQTLVLFTVLTIRFGHVNQRLPFEIFTMFSELIFFLENLIYSYFLSC